VLGASSIAGLLRRLAGSLRSTLAPAGRWSHVPVKHGHELSLAPSELALNELRGTRDWRAIPSLAGTLLHEDPSVRRAGAAVIVDLASYIPVASLPGFEERLRDQTWQHRAWHELRLEWIAKQEWPLRVWAMLTMHRSGFVREAAMRRLVSSGNFELALPFLLLRVNDWVSEVRLFAIDAVRSLIDVKHVALWIPVLELVDKLSLRSRVGHLWLSEGVTALFLRPESRSALMTAARSDDRAVARWAFRVAIAAGTNREELVKLAIASTDSLVRLRAAAAVRSWKQCPGREQFLARLARDRFMPVRREALYAALDDAPESRRAFLYAALLDRHASMRDAARFYLRQQPEPTHDPFDARAFYLSALMNEEPRLQAPAIAGIGECGSRADADALVPYVAQRSSGIAAAAVRAIASLDRDSRIGWFIELLKDDRPGVAKEACRAIVASGYLVPVEPVRSILRSQPQDHSSRLALRVLLRRHPYDAVVDALSAIGSGEPSLVRMGSEFIERANHWKVAYGPSDAQRAAAQCAMEGLSHPLAETSKKRLREFMGLALE
jgi:hypothetical protein